MNQLNSLSTKYTSISFDELGFVSESNKMMYFICTETWLWLGAVDHNGLLHGAPRNGICKVSGCNYRESGYVLQSSSCVATTGTGNPNNNGPTTTPNEGPNGYGTGSNPFVSAPNYTQPWENVQKCMNGFDQPNTVDNTVMDSLAINWLKANKHKAGNIQNFLGESGCSEDAQEIMLDVTSIMITNPNMDFEEAFEQYFMNNPDIIVIDGPDVIIEDMEEYLNCFNTQSGASNAKVTVSVDEPLEDSVLIWTVGDGVGHTFITIEQGDNIASFGFYPLYSLPSLFTPVQGVMGDNSNTEYDVSLIISNISPSDLQLVIEHAINYANLEYDLNWNNCTDMGISMANLIGIPIPECNANPITFFGSTPGRLGRYIRSLSTPLPDNVERNKSGGNSPSNNCN